jgi:methionyl-tRNA synthetase
VVRLKKFYITTAIPYVNSEPHIGHALEFVQTDAIKRFHELLQEDTFLTTGADENSLKNVQAAEEEGISIKQLCDKYSKKFKETMKLLDLSFNSFMRSSSKEHISGSQKLWKLCSKDIYKKMYKGLYCIGCEAFLTESELVDGKCKEHNKEPELVEEENYFFRLSSYQKQLEELIANDKLKIVPESRKNEVLSLVKSGLEDFSISRSRKRAKGWGVPVPGDDSQIMYVWLDALNVYQTSVGFGRDEKQYKKWWPADVHVIGKGILRFHAVYWPAILLSAGLPLPKELFVHGYITINGSKISKSLGNVINPSSMVEKYGLDQFRYYLIRNISPFNDGDFSEKQLVERVNEELVSNYSNLFYRVTSFIEKNFSGKVPKAEEDKEITKLIKKKTEEYKKKLENFKLNEALEAAISLSGEGNNYFQRNKPWEAVKNNKKLCEKTLFNSAQIIASVSSLLYPFIPSSAEKALKALSAKPSLDAKAGSKIKAIMLFKNIETDIRKETENSIIEKIKLADNMIPFKEFKKVDLRIGTIVDVNDHPDADKLFILQVDLGTEQRQLVAGLKGIYKKEELQNKQVIVVCNLESKEMRGVESKGMLLAAEDGTILSPGKTVKNGSKVM